jgi:protein-S-isoprenylcysteine O-methyltransferase Ste14
MNKETNGNQSLEPAAAHRGGRWRPVKPVKTQKGRAWLWVLAQAVLLAGLLFLPPGPVAAPLLRLRPLAYLLEAVGLLVAVAAALNLGNALTPLPSPREGGALQTGGLYRYVRHPLYTGVLVWGTGFVLAFPGPWRLLLFAMLCVFFSKKARYEEALLRERFAEYAHYTERTPRFFPRLNAASGRG